MLAPRELPLEYLQWNREHDAPFGVKWWTRLLWSNTLGMYSMKYGPGWFAWKYRTWWPSWVLRSIGPFGFQQNSATRTYEYPWAFYATPLGSEGLRAVDIGSGASGFQFVLASAGIEVISIDPLINPSESVDWQFSQEDFGRINRAFGGKVRFVKDFLEAAHLEADSCDRVYAISVLEHIPREPVIRLVQEIARILRPGGYFVATIDLFLDCYPFMNRLENQYGSNISVKELIEASGFQMTLGKPSQLCGFSEFSPDAVIKRKEEYLVVDHVMTQCVVMQKTSST